LGCADDMIEVVVAIAKDPTPAKRDPIMAAGKVLDRGYGNPAQQSRQRPPPSNIPRIGMIESSSGSTGIRLVTQWIEKEETQA
jgi:hypothetical protein